MPAENEVKYVLDDPENNLENHLTETLQGYDILQSYLDRDSRLRIFRPNNGEFSFIKRNGGRELLKEGDMPVFSFKRKIAGRQIEIETDVSADDATALLPSAELYVRKRRFSIQDGEVKWDIDFFKGRAGNTYFILAEAEMPEHMQEPERIPACISAHLLLSIGRASGFGNRKLADEKAVSAAFSVMRDKISMQGNLPSYVIEEDSLSMAA